MELSLYDDDLKPEFQNLNTSQTKFHHFNERAQQAMKITGRSVFKRRDTYNAIIPPDTNRAGRFLWERR